MRVIRFVLFLMAGAMILAGPASAQFGQHYSKETALSLWVWDMNWGGTIIHRQMVFGSLVTDPELPPLGDYYGVVSGNWGRWYFEGRIRKPISDLLICVSGLVFKEQFPQTDGYVAQTGRVPNGPINLLDQPKIAAWATPADYRYAQPYGPTPLPDAGAWNPYYLTTRILSGLGGNVPLLRTAPGIPGGAGIVPITLINGFQLCYVVKLPETGYDTLANFDGDAANPIFAMIQNDSGNETEVALASGDRITVQIDIPSGHLHNIYLSTSSSVVIKYITPNP